MSIQIQNLDTGLIRVTVSGKLTQPELASSQRALAKQLAGGEKASILVDARDFGGWAAGGDWSDLDAQLSIDPLIRKMAIVTEPEWEGLASAFTGKGLRAFPVEIFAPSDYQKALSWATQA
jgi:hypothetical protein